MFAKLSTFELRQPANLFVTERDELIPLKSLRETETIHGPDAVCKQALSICAKLFEVKL